MSPDRSRFVTACQQLLVLGAVLAALVPAARVVSLDVVAAPPGPLRATSGADPARSLRQLVGHPLGRRDLVSALW